MCFGGAEAVYWAWEVTDSHKGALSSLQQGFNQNQAVTGRRLSGTSGLQAAGGGRLIDLE